MITQTMICNYKVLLHMHYYTGEVIESIANSLSKATNFEVTTNQNTITFYVKFTSALTSEQIGSIVKIFEEILYNMLYTANIDTSDSSMSYLTPDIMKEIVTEYLSCMYSQYMLSNCLVISL